MCYEFHKIVVPASQYLLNLYQTADKNGELEDGPPLSGGEALRSGQHVAFVLPSLEGSSHFHLPEFRTPHGRNTLRCSSKTTRRITRAVKRGCACRIMSSQMITSAHHTNSTWGVSHTTTHTYHILRPHPETSNRQNLKSPTISVRSYCRMELARYHRPPVQWTYETRNPHRGPNI